MGPLTQYRLDSSRILRPASPDIDVIYRETNAVFITGAPAWVLVDGENNMLEVISGVPEKILKVMLERQSKTIDGYVMATVGPYAESQ